MDIQPSSVLEFVIGLTYTVERTTMVHACAKQPGYSTHDKLLFDWTTSRFPYHPGALQNIRHLTNACVRIPSTIIYYFLQDAGLIGDETSQV